MNNAQYDEMTSKGKQSGELSVEQVAGWLQEIDTAKKREKDWRAQSKKYVELYEGYKRDQSPFNILFSNTETLMPALYNNTPRPAVGRRFKDKDPLGAAVALTTNRMLVFTMDSNNAGEYAFDDLVEHAILQALVPGRGTCRWKYDADVTTKVMPMPGVKELPNTPEDGNAIQSLEIPEVTNERICGETVEYDGFTHGFAKKWNRVPWVSFEHHMTRAELKENFGAVGEKVAISELEYDDDVKSSDKDGRKLAIVYELWDRNTKKVIFLSPGYKDGELKIADDPLSLSGFFPCPEPLHFIRKISSQVPQAPYELYRSQAEELNNITRRIDAVIGALKVRGAYATELTELPEILKADDNVLVAVENVMMMQDGKSLKDYIFLMPLGELIAVLQQLYVQRTQVKTVIYEITGISDILRGSSVASETATAQDIKNQWGTLRLKAMQKRVSRWCRENMRIIAEIGANKFSRETFQRMTGLPYVTAEQKQQTQMQLQQMQQAQQQQPQQPGQPPAPPQQPPQEMLDILATPVWEEILGLLKDKIGTEFRIDIETNSTIADDMAEDNKNMGELLNALSQFLNGVAPLIENGTMPFDVAKAMMLGLTRKMAMGPEIEEHLEKMKPPTPPEKEQPPAPPPPPPVDPNIELKAQVEAAALQQQMEVNQMRMAEAKAEHENKMELLKLKRQMDAEKFAQQMAMAKQKASAPSGDSHANV